MNIAVKEQNMQQHQQPWPQQDIPSNNQLHDPILKCLKVSPNLFTPEKLNIFDTVGFYTTLINCSQHIEQGERLNNLSWRIINKALLKDKSINKSKKRDGVKNLYYVLNPVNNKNNINKNNITSSNGSNNTSKSNDHKVFNPNMNSTNKSNIEEDANNKEQPTGKNTTLNSTYRSSSGLFPLLGQRYQHHEYFRADYNHNNTSSNHNNKNTYLHLNDNHKTRNDINSNGKHPIVVTGFDTNTLITKTKTIKSDSSNHVNNLSNDNSKYSKYNKNGNSNNNNNNNNNALNLTRQKNSLFTYTSSKYNNGNSHTNDNDNHNHNSNRIFFSSEDEDEEDSEWNSLSSDEDDYDYDDYSDDNNLENSHTTNKKDKFIHEDDEEDDDQYYKKQWNKLVFTKQSKLRATVSPSDSIPSSVDRSNDGLTPSNSNDQIVRKSLLSGLFSNEKNHHSNNSTPSPNSKLLSGQNSSTSSLHHHHHHVLPTTSNITHLNKDTIAVATTTVTAHGSVTSAQGPMNAIVPLEEMMQRERRGRQMNRPLTTTLTDSKKLSRKNSYNSLFSEEDEEEEDGFNSKETLRGRSNIYSNQNHDKQSNAPLTAQTILPTALSTHMFLPNSIIQQRRASRTGNTIEETRRNTSSGLLRDQVGQAPTTRRESIDIPVKNRGRLFLKTRMEISEEEKYIRRKHLGNAN